LHWRALSPMKPNYTVFVHLLDAQGAVRAQTDTPPLNGARPTSEWESGEWIEDHYSFAVPSDLPAGNYMLEIGLYDSGTGLRLPLLDATGHRFPDDRLLIEGLSLE